MWFYFYRQFNFQNWIFHNVSNHTSKIFEEKSNFVYFFRHAFEIEKCHQMNMISHESRKSEYESFQINQSRQSPETFQVQ